MTNAQTSPDALLDLRAAATYLSCSQRNVQNLWRARELPAVKIGRLLRFRRSDLDQFVADHVVEAVR